MLQEFHNKGSGESTESHALHPGRQAAAAPSHGRPAGPPLQPPGVALYLLAEAVCNLNVLKVSMKPIDIKNRPAAIGHRGQTEESGEVQRNVSRAGFI